MTNMPSYRLTIDMRDLDGARLIITTGQSGNPLIATTTTSIGRESAVRRSRCRSRRPPLSAAAASTLTLTP